MLEDSEQYTRLLAKIQNRTAVVGIMGLGYVGLPLALHLAKAGFRVIGLDIAPERVRALNSGESSILDIPNELLQEIHGSGHFRATTDFGQLAQVDAVCVCVPTPLGSHQEPDLSYIQAALSELKEKLSSGVLVILESTTYPGTTEELLLSELEASGRKLGQDFFLCFSPERVDPGNARFNTGNTPKVVGGVTRQCRELGMALYGSFLSSLVPVSSPKVAEMSKLLENTFRSVNIAFVNELALLCERLEVDVWEVIDAAATKPFGFMPFYPGPGIGGHCIPLDPMYLSWKAKSANFFSRFIDLSQEINRKMPEVVVTKAAEALNSVAKPLRGSKILLMGMAYKPDVDDLRESPGLELFELLSATGAKVSFVDPLARKFVDRSGQIVGSLSLTSEVLSSSDCVILVTNHSVFDLQFILEHAPLILDTRNAFKNLKSEKIVKLGAPLAHSPISSRQ